jgi:uncharacterized protein YjbI with pentapeptide repeats
MNSFFKKALIPALSFMATLTGWATPESEQVVLRDGTFYPALIGGGNLLINGSWEEDPYPTLADLYAAMGLSSTGGQIRDQAFYNNNVWGEDFASNDEAPAFFGYNSMEELLADPGWGGPYESVDAMVDDWVANGWVEEDVNPDFSTIDTETEWISFAKKAGSIPESILTEAANYAGLSPENAVSFYNNLNKQNEGSHAAALQIFARSTTASDTLYTTRTQLDFSGFTGADIANVGLSGRDFTGTNLTNSQITSAVSALNGGFGGPSLANSNFSGLNLTGLSAQAASPIWALSGQYGGLIGGMDLTGANLSNTQGLTAATIAGAGGVNGLNLTGTGITRAAYEAALRTLLQNAVTPQGMTPISEQQIQNTINSKANSIIF